MKEVIMTPTLMLLQQETVAQLIQNGFVPKKTKDGVNYLIRNNKAK